MLSRRMIMTMIAAATFLVVPPGAIRHARAQSGEQAITFVKTTSDELVAVVNGPGSPQEKRRRLQAVLDRYVDVDDIARFCLGRFWKIATDDQQTEYMILFHDLLVDKIASHLGEYRGVRVTMGLARASADTQIVITLVDRPRTDTSQIDWVVATTSGGPKIVDLLAEGTSLRLTQASDFTAYLSRHQYSVHALIEGMRQVIAQIQ
jgi:phospholipid transport system substrate-binding protein